MNYNYISLIISPIGDRFDVSILYRTNSLKECIEKSKNVQGDIIILERDVFKILSQDLNSPLTLEQVNEFRGFQVQDRKMDFVLIIAIIVSILILIYIGYEIFSFLL